MRRNVAILERLVRALPSSILDDGRRGANRDDQHDGTDQGNVDNQLTPATLMICIDLDKPARTDLAGSATASDNASAANVLILQSPGVPVGLSTHLTDEEVGLHVVSGVVHLIVRTSAVCLSRASGDRQHRFVRCLLVPDISHP